MFFVFGLKAFGRLSGICGYGGDELPGGGDDEHGALEYLQVFVCNCWKDLAAILGFVVVFYGI